MWDNDTLLVTPVLRYRPLRSIGGNRRDLWPVRVIWRERRQRDLFGGPLDPWYRDGVVAEAVAYGRAREMAEAAALKGE